MKTTSNLYWLNNIFNSLIFLPFACGTISIRMGKLLYSGIPLLKTIPIATTTTFPEIPRCEVFLVRTVFSTNSPFSMKLKMNVMSTWCDIYRYFWLHLSHNSAGDLKIWRLTCRTSTNYTAIIFNVAIEKCERGGGASSETLNSKLYSTYVRFKWQKFC